MDKIKNANIEGFVVLGHGYSKDLAHAFYHNYTMEGVDIETLKVIQNKYHLAIAVDENGLILRGKRLTVNVDSKSFEVLKRPYYKDKNKVYYSDKFLILQQADSATFNIPELSRITNIQSYAFDKNNAYYFDSKGKVRLINNIDYESFQVLSSDYSKDKNRVYYKSTILELADPMSFHIPHSINPHVGKDATNHFVQGVMRK